MTDNERSWLLELPDVCLMRTANDLGLGRACSVRPGPTASCMRQLLWRCAKLYLQQADGLMLYVEQHGQHVDSLKEN